ncbi:MAG: hypothetical protein KKG76_06590 [Euryarchaeota archaeon]|nr:hypothetical protein [Euryarchaeota archaeon]
MGLFGRTPYGADNKIPIMVSLGVVAAILIASVALSVIRARMLEYRARELKKFQEHE